MTGFSAISRPAALGAEASPHDEVIHIIQGEHHVASKPNVKLVTLLGSCVAACLYDSVRGIGGMNHFLLPGDLENTTGAAERCAVHAMEVLVNALLKRGASRTHLRAKIFGGASTMAGLSDVGSQNARFALAFLGKEGIEITSQCLGGTQGRRVQFWPATGRARRSFMTYETTMLDVVAKPNVVPAHGTLELF